MGEINRDVIDKQIESQGREEQMPVGVLGEVYALLGKGLSLGEISNELRISEAKLRWLLYGRTNQ